MSIDIKKKRILIGKVVSKKMQKTSTVKMTVICKDKNVHKVIRKTKVFQVHDPSDISNIGDTVEFYEGRPISKTKFMYIEKVVSAKNNIVGDI